MSYTPLAAVTEGTEKTPWTNSEPVSGCRSCCSSNGAGASFRKQQEHNVIFAPPDASQVPSDSFETDGGDRSVAQISLSLIQVTVGAGIMGLPYALKQAGFGLGLIMMIAVAYLTQGSLVMMMDVGRRLRVSSYSSFVSKAFGPYGANLLNAVLLLNGFGTMISYLVLVGNTLSEVVPIGTFLGLQDPFIHRALLVVVCALASVLPAVFFRKMGQLSRLSVLCCLCIPAVLVLVVCRCFIKVGDADPLLNLAANKTELHWFGDRPFAALGVMAFAFVSNQAAFPLYLSLREPSIGRWFTSTSVAITISLLLSLCMAVIGYLTFGPQVPADLLSAFPADDAMIQAARIILAVAMMLTYPLQFYPARLAALHLFKYETDQRQASKKAFYCATAIVFVVTVVVSALVANLGVVYELVGGFCSNMMAYLMPGCVVVALYLHKRKYWLERLEEQANTDRMEAEEDSEDEEEPLLPKNHSKEERPWTLWSLPLSFLLLAFGVLGVTAGVGSTLYRVFTSSS